MRYVITNYDDTERRRLAALAALLDPYTMRALEQIGIQPDWHCIEIGAGLGTVSQWMADRLSGDGEVLCTDLQTEYINEIDHPLIRVEKLDITQPPPLNETFDLAVTRAVHHHIPDRNAALRNLERMVRSGGHIVYIEPDIHPAFCDDHPAWKHLFQAIFQWGDRRDIDYYAGRRVPEELKALGIDVMWARGETALFNGPEDPAHEVLRMTFDILLPEIVGQGFISRAESEEAYALLDNPDVWLMGLCFFVTVARKPHGQGA